MFRTNLLLWRSTIVAAFIYVYLPSADAALVTLTSDSPVNAPVEFLAGQVSAPITIGVFNDVVPDAPADYLTGWQVTLTLIPEAGATGTATFATPIGPSVAEPSNYLLSGINNGIVAANTGNELLVFDFNSPYSGGVEVPLTPGAPLFSFTVTSSNDAMGTFGIYALSESGATEWTDATVGSQLKRSFLNIEPDTGPVRIGAILIAVPEPVAFKEIAAVALLLAFAYGWRSWFNFSA